MDDQSVEAVRRAIMSQAHAEAREILDEARGEAQSIREEAKREAESERDALLRQARAKAERVREEAQAEAEIRARRVKLRHREELLESVFSAARQRLQAAPEWSDYLEVVEWLAREGVEHLGGEEAVVRVDERSAQVLGDRLPELVRSVGEELKIELTIGEPLHEGTGVVVQTRDGHRCYDNALETRLTRMADALRTPVYRILTEGES